MRSEVRPSAQALLWEQIALADRLGLLRGLPSGGVAIAWCTGRRHISADLDGRPIYHNLGRCTCGPCGAPRMPPDLSVTPDNKSFAAGIKTDKDC